MPLATPTAGSPSVEASGKKRSVLLGRYGEPSAAAARGRANGTSARSRSSVIARMLPFLLHTERRNENYRLRAMGAIRAKRACELMPMARSAGLPTVERTLHRPHQKQPEDNGERPSRRDPERPDDYPKERRDRPRDEPGDDPMGRLPP